MKYKQIKKLFFLAFFLLILNSYCPVPAIAQDYYRLNKIFMISPEAIKKFKTKDLPKDIAIKNAIDKDNEQWKKLHPGYGTTIYLDKYKVKQGDSITVILESSSIRADENSISIFQRLNPQINNPDHLQPDQEVITPKIKREDESEAIQPIDKYALIHDYKTRRSLKETASLFENMGNKLEAKMTSAGINNQHTAALKTAITSYNKNLIVASKDPVIPDLLRMEMNTESKALADYLSATINSINSEMDVTTAINTLDMAKKK